MDIFLGFAAGLLATAILSVMMLGKRALGIMPRLSMIDMLARVTGEPRPVDWLFHFAVGTFFYGLLIALIADMTPLAYWAEGLIVGAIGWMLAGLVLMPAAGRGFFGSEIGPSAFFMSMMVHAVQGLLLGLIYGWLV